MKIYLTLFLALLATSSFAHNWELNDVSILFSLPQEGDSEDFLLRADSVGKKGTLFPENQKSFIQDLIISYDRPEPEDIYHSIRVMGVRIDPCFKFTDMVLEKCNPQIRMVWQPTAGLNTSEVRSFDGAIHTFYALTQKEFNELAKDLMLLKNENASLGVTTQGKALGVHPAFLNKKTKDIFNKKFKTTLLKYAGEKNLVRFTFMKLLTTDLWWSFEGRDKTAQGDWIDTKIPKVPQGETKQDFFNEASMNPTGMRGFFIPNIITSFDSLEDLIKGYGVPENASGIEKMRKGMETINRIENPNIHSPATLDCVHCHITDGTRLWAQTERKPLYQKAQNSAFLYTQAFLGRHNPKNITDKNKHNKSLRAFGYYKNKPSINQRMINETISVADMMNQMKLNLN